MRRGIIALVTATDWKCAPFEENLPAELLNGAEPSTCLDHIGIAVRSIETAGGIYRVLGLEVGATEEIAHEGVRVAMVRLGATRIELLEPMSEDSVIGRFLARRGEGLHHVAIRVEEVEKKYDQCVAAGVRLASDAIRVGAGGHRYFFIHPASASGVLVEIVGE